MDQSLPECGRESGLSLHQSEALAWSKVRAECAPESGLSVTRVRAECAPESGLSVTRVRPECGTESS